MSNNRKTCIWNLLQRFGFGMFSWNFNMKPTPTVNQTNPLNRLWFFLLSFFNYFAYIRCAIEVEMYSMARLVFVDVNSDCLHFICI